MHRERDGRERKAPAALLAFDSRVGRSAARHRMQNRFTITGCPGWQSARRRGKETPWSWNGHEGHTKLCPRRESLRHNCLNKHRGNRSGRRPGPVHHEPIAPNGKTSINVERSSGHNSRTIVRDSDMRGLLAGWREIVRHITDRTSMPTSSVTTAHSEPA